MSEDELVAQAVADLAQRLGLAEGEVEIVRVQPVQWPNGAIGCPEEGVIYTQAVVDGTQVLLRSGGRVYDYHAGSEGDIFMCESDEKDGGYSFVPPPGFDN